MSEVIVYRDIPHTYHGLTSGLEYHSVSRVYSSMVPYKDWEGILQGSARKQGVDPEWLRAEWDRKKHMGTSAGTIVHEEREKDLLSEFVVEFGGGLYTPIPYEVDAKTPDIKYQIKDLKEGEMYPELIVNHPTLRLSGTSDEVYIEKGGWVHIQDTKTDRSIEYEGFNGATLTNGLEHRQDCNYVAYSIKCSTYMYFILKSSPHLKPGRIFLRHTPIKRDEEGCAVINDDGTVDVLSKEIIEVNYEDNKKDVEIMINHFVKTNKYV